MASSEYELSSEEFSLERVIAQGAFAKVWMCRKKDRSEIVAAKIPKNNSSRRTEVGLFLDFDVYLIDCIVVYFVHNYKCKKANFL